MIFSALDENGDWTFGKGLNSYVKGLDAILLNIKTRLLFWKGECFFALDEGIDYNNLLSSPNSQALEVEIRRTILTSEGVIRIVSFSATHDETERHTNIEATIDTIYGQAQIEV